MLTLFLKLLTGQSVGPQIHRYTQNYTQTSYNQTGPKCFDYNYKGSCIKKSLYLTTPLIKVQ